MMGIQRKEKGKDPYSASYSRALEIIQGLAGKRWTDFNPHDPGVTMLDVFCYGLLDIEYRLGFDFSDYLPHDVSGQIDYRAWGLHPAEELFADAIVTPQDYAVLVQANLSDVRACDVAWTEQGYRISVALRKEADAGQIIRAVTDLYYRNRNLNERLFEVVVQDDIPEANAPAPYAADIQMQDVPALGRMPIPLAGYRHKSLQYDMPATYGLGVEGAPPHADVAHQAYILQLKGYMLLVDYLFSSVDQQLQAIPSLMGHAPYGRPEFEPVVEIESLGKLLDEGVGFSKVYNTAMGTAKRLSFAKMCCVLYGEDADELLQLLRVNFDGDALAERFVYITSCLPEWQMHRAKGMDILPGAVRTMPAIKRFLTAVLGQDSEQENALANRIGEWKLLGDEDFRQQYRHLHAWQDSPAAGKVYKVPVIAAGPEGRIRSALAGGDLLSTQVLPELLLSVGALPSHYRIVLHQGMYTLYCTDAGQRQWLQLGQSKNGNRMIEHANLLWAAIKEVRARAYTLYIVEHALLPQAQDNDDASHITVIMPAVWKAIYGQHRLEEWLRRRMPASLLVVFKWLDLGGFTAFESDYLTWKSAFKQKKPAELIRTANLVRRWL